jgi:hypothetical protein
VVYVVTTDNVTVTLPAASTKGQMLIVIETANINNGISIQRSGTDTITGSGGNQGLTVLGPGSSFFIVSSGSGKWVSLGPQ